jgi:hypothetical protein
MARSNQRGRNNNNPSGRNQYSSDWMGTVRDRPMASAAAAAAAVGAGVFLWSKRNQISDQIGRLSDQLSDWSEQRGWSGTDSEMAMAEGSDSSASTSSGSNRSSGNTAKSRTTAGRATPQSTTM